MWTDTLECSAFRERSLQPCSVLTSRTGCSTYCISTFSEAGSTVATNTWDGFFVPVNSPLKTRDCRHRTTTRGGTLPYSSCGTRTTTRPTWHVRQSFYKDPGLGGCMSAVCSFLCPWQKRGNRSLNAMQWRRIKYPCTGHVIGILSGAIWPADQRRRAPQFVVSVACLPKSCRAVATLDRWNVSFYHFFFGQQRRGGTSKRTARYGVWPYVLYYKLPNCTV